MSKKIIPILLVVLLAVAIVVIYLNFGKTNPDAEIVNNERTNELVAENNFFWVPEFGMKFPLPAGFSEVKALTGPQSAMVSINSFTYNGENFEVNDECRLYYLTVGVCGNNSECAENNEWFQPVTADYGLDYSSRRLNPYPEAGLAICAPFDQSVLQLSQMLESPAAI